MIRDASAIMQIEPASSIPGSLDPSQDLEVTCSTRRTWLADVDLEIRFGGGVSGTAADPSRAFTAWAASQRSARKIFLILVLFSSLMLLHVRPCVISEDVDGSLLQASCLSIGHTSNVQPPPQGSAFQVDAVAMRQGGSSEVFRALRQGVQQSSWGKQVACDCASIGVRNQVGQYVALDRARVKIGHQVAFDRAGSAIQRPTAPEPSWATSGGCARLVPKKQLCGYRGYHGAPYFTILVPISRFWPALVQGATCYT